MHTYLRNHEIDYAKWDDCVQASPQCLVYALSWYLDIVSPGWDAIVLKANGGYSQVMPLTKLRRIGIAYLQQPVACQQLGVFSRNGPVHAEELAPFLSAVVMNFRYSINYSLNTGNYPSPQFSPKGITLNPCLTHHLDLSVGYETIYQHYTQDRRMNLKRAQRANLRIVTGHDIEPLLGIFKKYTAHRIYGGVAPHTYQLLSRLFVKLTEKGLATLWYTYGASGEPNAGCLFVEFKNTIIYLFNAATQEARRDNGRTLMIDAMLQKNAGRQGVFDFESPEETSIAQFYESFGAQAKPFYSLSFNNLPFLVKTLRAGRLYLYRRFIHHPEN
jgi:hypothetical protein